MHKSIVGNLQRTKQTKQEEKWVVLQLQIYFLFCNSVITTLKQYYVPSFSVVIDTGSIEDDCGVINEK